MALSYKDHLCCLDPRLRGEDLRGEERSEAGWRCRKTRILSRAYMMRLSSFTETQEAFMRTVILTATVFATLSLLTIGARADGAWCARDPKGSTNCGFHTYAQCEATCRGCCAPNPDYRGSATRGARPSDNGFDRSRR